MDADDKNKISVCCIAKMENLYIREFVEHYKELGCFRIYLYDNNLIEGERFDEVIGDYIDDGFVEVEDWRGRTYCQTLSYQDCYDRHSKNCDWILYVDCDEFLTIADGSENIGEFMSKEIFNEYSIVVFNWICYGDSDLLEYDGRKLQERFIKPFEPIMDFTSNRHIKVMVRTNKGIDWRRCNPHMPSIIDPSVLICDTNGNRCDNSPFQSIQYKNAYLKHYVTKTLEEWVTIKATRGFADANKDYFKTHDILEAFYGWGNKRTVEKDALYRKLIKEYRIKHRNIIFCIKVICKRCVGSVVSALKMQ